MRGDDGITIASLSYKVGGAVTQKLSALAKLSEFDQESRLKFSFSRGWNLALESRVVAHRRTTFTGMDGLNKCL